MKKIFIGIDFSKEKFDATLIKAEGVKECGPSVHGSFWHRFLMANFGAGNSISCCHTVLRHVWRGIGHRTIGGNEDY